jgi:hypothetical protein
LWRYNSFKEAGLLINFARQVYRLQSYGRAALVFVGLFTKLYDAIAAFYRTPMRSQRLHGYLEADGQTYTINFVFPN